RIDPSSEYLGHNPGEGRIFPHGMRPHFESFVPQADGAPALKNCKIVAAQRRANVLAVLTQDLKAKHSRKDAPKAMLRLYSGPEGIPLAEYRVLDEKFGFVLSPDARWLALQVDDNRVEVRDIVQGGPPTLVTRVGGCHQRVWAHLGRGFLRFTEGKYTHQ